MPIHESERARYPADWKEISLRVKDRASWRCECEGECRSLAHEVWSSNHEEARCPNRHGEASEFSGAKVVLTTAHLDHTPENLDEARNLRAYCQSCHLNYDRAHHAQTRAQTRLAQNL